jgi:hypothetical protein
VVPFFYKGVIDLESAGVIDLEEVKVGGEIGGDGSEVV